VILFVSFCISKPTKNLPAGIHSPTLSGSSQLDAYRPLFLPTILVGDSKLGGISSTISAYESLLLRGYIVDAVLLFKDDCYRNWEYLTSYFAEKGITVTTIEPPPDRDSEHNRDSIQTENYYKDLAETPDTGISQVVRQLSERHEKRLQELDSLPSRTLSNIWWPFVQHGTAKPLTVIDSAHKDFFSVHNTSGGSESGSLLDSQFDGSASWWTQGLGHSNPALTLAAARAAGRYGHVLFPQAAHLPAVTLAETLLSPKGPGHGWAKRVFFSDDGSTGMEVALKMALRSYSKRFGVKDADKKNLGVLGLKGSYHGDTIGAMNACEAGEGVYTCEWHDSKGFWFDPPTIGIRSGRVVVSLPDAIADIVEAERSIELMRDLAGDSGGRGEVGMGLALAQVYDVRKRVGTRLAKVYKGYIESVLDKLDASGVKLAALVLEPLVMGAGGMIFADPLFQRVLIDVVRSRDTSNDRSDTTWSGVPVIFDEVFVGLYRLGHLSTKSVLGTNPDISVHAKLLTGGLVPLAATLAKEGIFEAFVGDSKDQALLHGHSYTAYPVGCEVANETFKQTEKLINAEPWAAAQAKWGRVDMKQVVGVEGEHAHNVWSFWDPGFIDVLSRLKAVDDVMALGTLLVVRVNDSSRGAFLQFYVSHGVY
jgi:dethiobiotin synthetase/adenosylmethionine--8-amino-7-oxononanoate aminotransferase